MWRAGWIVLLSLIASGGWALALEPVPAGANKLCPVMVDQPTRSDRSVSYQGKTIFFCCDKCIAKFNANPAKYIANLSGTPTAQAATDEPQQAPVATEETPSIFKELAELFGRLHVSIVHFPIALIVVAGVIELFRLRGKDKSPSQTAYVCLLLGAGAAVLSAAMGWAHAAQAFEGDPSRVLQIHRWLGTSLAIGASIAAIVAIAAHRRQTPGLVSTYRLATILCAAWVGTTAHFGGAITYGADYYTSIFRSSDAIERTTEPKIQPRTELATNQPPQSKPATAPAPADSTMQALLFGTPQEVRLARIQVRLAAVPIPPQPPTADGPVVNEIDRFVVAKWKSAKLPESQSAPALCDDATFCRRVYLDLIGVIPTAEEAKKFADDKSSDKRAKLIDAMLARNDAYAAHWTPYWEEAIASNPFAIQGGIPTHGNYQEWIYESFQTNKPYDVMVSQLIDPTEPGYKRIAAAKVIDVEERPGYIQNATHTQTLQSAANVGQFFLGTEMKCASCHSHFLNDEWPQQRFLGFAGLFGSKDLELIRCEKRSDKIVPAHFAFDLPQAPTETPKAIDERLHLAARLITDPANPRFARTAVNRLWKRYLGLGFFEPADDFRVDSPSANPELLDWLAYDFLEHGYDLKHTIRLILNSRTYQLKYDPKLEDHFDLAKRSDPRYWRSPALRRLTAEQLVDSIRVATNQKLEESARLYHTVQSTTLTRALGRPALRNEISTQRPEDVAVVQSLELLNGQEWYNLIYSSPIVLELAREKESRPVVDRLFWATLSRQPRDAEARTTDTFIKQSPAPPTTMPSSIDIVWLDDDLPKGASPMGSAGSESWQWATTKPVFSGTRSHFQESAVDKWTQHYAIGANPPLVLESENDVLYAYVFIEKGKPPKELMLQWNVGGSWEHRGAWGNRALIPAGTEGTEGRVRVGTVPKPGQWTRLEVTARQVGMKKGTEINGISFDQFGGKVYWDKAGVVKKPTIEIPAYGDILWTMFTSPEFQYIR